MNKLTVFDFDGTLFRSPLDTPQNHKLYEKATGIPWLISKEEARELSRKHGRYIGMRRGWWGRSETLEPPLVPKPAPAEWFIDHVVKQLHASKADPDSHTIIMTGRHAGLKHQVLRICDDGGLVNLQKRQSKSGDVFYEMVDDQVTCWFLGEDGPRPRGNKPTETFPWKVSILEQYVDLFPDIKTIEIYEDRVEHVEKFRELHGILTDTVTVYHIQD